MAKHMVPPHIASDHLVLNHERGAPVQLPRRRNASEQWHVRRGAPGHLWHEMVNGEMMDDGQ